MTKLVINNVNKYYNKKLILSNINLSVSERECVGIMGESGSGKSTLAKLIVGLELLDEGDMILDGISYKSLSKKEMKKIYRKVQMVFQNALGAVNPRFTIEEILLEPLRIHYKKTLSYEEMKKRAKDLLEKVGLRAEFLSRKATELSGGQLQRVCIARALILEPKIIVFDESISGLDPVVQQQILELLAELRETMNLTYVFISHDFEACYYLCDKVVIMENGEIKDVISDLDSPIVINNERVKKIVGKSLNHIEYIEK